jgi:hypothetical protein
MKDRMSTEPSAQLSDMEPIISSQFTEIRVQGKTVLVPSTVVQGRTIIVKGKWVKIASVEDEDCFEGDVVDNPDLFLTQLRQGPFKADLFTFEQKPTSSKPQYGYHMEWDNAAIIPITDYAHWWESLPQETRRNVRKAAKLGVDVKAVQFDDELVRGIVDIYNETPIRQGRQFWHYGKSFEAVKKETATYLERSEFVGAYFANSMIGFIKLLYVDKCATVIHILSKEQHADKRPTNALIAKAVEVCAAKGITSFQYCKYVYGKNETSPLTEFKRRNGFERVLYPRYFVPLSQRVLVALRGFRRMVLENLSRTNSGTSKPQVSS